MNYVDVSTFLTLVAEGSVLGAAKTLGVSRATVRRRLAALEKSLGRPLLEREADAVVLTTVGRLLQREGPSLVGAARRLEGALKQVGTEVSGTLTVAMLNGLPGALFTAFARELAERWPSMEVVAVFTPDPLRELERQADVAITSGERPGEPWVARVLAHEEEGAFAHRQYLERAGRPRTLADLEHHRLLSWSTADVSARAWPLRRGGTYAPRPVLTTNDLRSLYDCVDASLGIAMVPRWFKRPEWEPVLPAVLGQRRRYWLASGAAGRWSPTVRAFAQSLTQFVSTELARSSRE